MLKDITIKGIPEEAIEEVLRMASVAIKRFYKKDLTVSEEKKTAFEKNVDAFLESNAILEIQ